MAVASPSPRAAAAPALAPAQQELDAVRRGCTRAIRAGKSHLQVCLKLLGILYKGEDESSGLADVQAGDDLYYSMVMLNSSLLKALHVVDSFQLHCYREMPRGLVAEADGAAQLQEHDDLAPFPAEEEAERTESQERIGDGFDGCGGAVAGEGYRRLQAQCVVLSESIRSVEQQRGSDAARLALLDEECKRIRAALKGEAAKKAAPAQEEEVHLFGHDFRVERRPSGAVVVSEPDLKRWAQEAQDLRRAAREARGEAESADAGAKEGEARAAEVAREEEELRLLLGCATLEDLPRALEQLAAEVDGPTSNGVQGVQPLPAAASEPPLPVAPPEQLVAAVAAEDAAAPPAAPRGPPSGGAGTVTAAAASAAAAAVERGRGAQGGGPEAVNRRAAYGALLEAKAALRYVKSRDSQALGRLASLLGGNMRVEQAGAAASEEALPQTPGEQMPIAASVPTASDHPGRPSSSA